MPGNRDRATILIVDDEEKVRAILRQALEKEGFFVEEANDRETLFATLRSHPIDLITLDLGLGTTDGLGFATEIRTHFNIPIIIVTGRDQPIDRIKGLECGADDYITKPFHLREVMLRVHRVRERYGQHLSLPGPSQANCYSFEHYRFDAIRRELRGSNGELIALTGHETQLLELFLKYPGRLLSRNEINTMLKGREWSPLDRTIDGHVARLRKKIEPPEDEAIIIKSIRGIGYVLTCAVSRV